MRLGAIAQLVDGRLEGDPEIEIEDVAALEDARPGTITFLADAKRASELRSTGASAAIVGEDAAAGDLPVVCVAHPYLAFVDVIEAFHPGAAPAPGRHASALVDASARVPDDAHVGPNVVVGRGVVLGPRAVLHAGVCLYEDVVAGADFVAHAGTVVREGSRIGDRVTLHAGVVIGSDGFGYVPTPNGPRKIPQVGRVVLEDDVEVGANSTIDRAGLGETHVERGTKIDNLVMVAHGVQVGRACLLAAQVGLAGGTRLGAGVMLGGQVGSAGHLTVGDGAMVAAKSGLTKDLPGGEAYGGIPAQPLAGWRRAVSGSRRVTEILRRLRRVEDALGLREGAKGE
jgi:UDP-3-O-[3-hydroxymyristoyl] glucosamine N-acyltransferase